LSKKQGEEESAAGGEGPAGLGKPSIGKKEILAEHKRGRARQKRAKERCHRTCRTLRGNQPKGEKGKKPLIMAKNSVHVALKRLNISFSGHRDTGEEGEGKIAPNSALHRPFMGWSRRGGRWG